MATLFYDGERCVQDFLMYWIAPSHDPKQTHGCQWVLHDTDGGEAYFNKKQGAIDALKAIADEG